MAYTRWPTSRSRLVPRAMGGSLSRGASMRSTARSRSGKAPTSRASKVLWSASVTRAPSAPWMTWKLVTMWPALSHTKPVPVPRGTCCTFMLKRSRCTPRLVMCTTEGPVFLNRSMCASSSAASGPRGVTARGTASVRPCTRAGYSIEAPTATAAASRAVKVWENFIGPISAGLPPSAFAGGFGGRKVKRRPGGGLALSSMMRGNAPDHETLPHQATT